MSMDYQLQMQNTFSSGIWFQPTMERIDGRPVRTSAAEVSTLRDEIAFIADHTNSTHWKHYRIITYRGGPVERWKVRAGEARKTRSRY